jgi:type I restriction enzyme S subunit
MSVVKEGWTYKNFEECLVKAPKAKQVQTSEYNSGTRYPIVSQEDKLVSGYCDDSSLLYHIDNPIVIFGDHTRVLKYVDFDFVVGADGVKILIPKEFLNAKFLFFYLQWYNIPSLGYSRHYKLLKEISIPVPPLPSQQSIVSELDKINELIALKKSQLKDLDSLAQSIFYEMFGDPITNEKEWDLSRLMDNVVEMFLGPFGSSLKVDSYVPIEESYCMVYEQKHAIQKSIYLDNHYINEEKYNSLSRFKVEAGDFIMSCRGTIGKLYRLPSNAPMGIIHPSLMKIRIKESSYNPTYFAYMLPIIVSNQNTYGNCVQMAITAKALGNMQLGLPPLSLQHQFAERVESIERIKQQVQTAIKDLETLLASRMQYWFD